MSFLAKYWYLMIGAPLLGVYLIYSIRHRGVETDKTIDEASVGSQWAIWKNVGFALVVLAYLYSSSLGYRIAGAALFAFGVRTITTRRVPYGIEGRAPSGYLSGAAAVILGILTAALGVFFIAAPQVVEEILRASASS